MRQQLQQAHHLEWAQRPDTDTVVNTNSKRIPTTTVFRLNQTITILIKLQSMIKMSKHSFDAPLSVPNRTVVVVAMRIITIIITTKQRRRVNQVVMRMAKHRRHRNRVVIDVTIIQIEIATAKGIVIVIVTVREIVIAIDETRTVIATETIIIIVIDARTKTARVEVAVAVITARREVEVKVESAAARQVANTSRPNHPRTGNNRNEQKTNNSLTVK